MKGLRCILPFSVLLVLAFTSLARAYPDRAELLREIEQIEAYLQKAQLAEGPDCTPAALAAAQGYLARAKEEYEEGDLWKAEDLLALCRKAADGLWEKILACKKDLDRDRIPDDRDRCPEAPEVYNGYRDEDGCPDRQPRRALLTGEKIEILEPVDFDQETQHPLPASLAVLREVAAIMRENPSLRIRILAFVDGHVPSGEADRITRLRAEAVCSVLVDLGISPARLEAEGRGGRDPIASNDTPWGRMMNRRIEFLRVP